MAQDSGTEERLRVGHAKKARVFDEALEVVQAEDPEMREAKVTQARHTFAPMSEELLPEATNEYLTPPVVEHTPESVEYDYPNFGPYFEMYGRALRGGDRATAEQIEALVRLARPSSFYISVPRAQLKDFEAQLTEARRNQAGLAWTKGYNDPEATDPSELGRLFQDLVRLCGGDMVLAAQYIHRGY